MAFSLLTIQYAERVEMIPRGEGKEGKGNEHGDILSPSGIGIQSANGGNAFQPPEKGGSLAKTIQAGILFLQSGEFQLVPEDYVKRKGKRGFSICQEQGSPALRRAARLFAKDQPAFFRPSILRKIRRFHERNFRILQLKRLGHALNLDGLLSLSDGTHTQYNGFSEAFSIPMLASSVQEYASRKESRISEKAGSWIAAILNNTSSSDLHTSGEGKELLDKMLDPNCPDPISISSGYDWHSTQLFIFRKHLIYCNRGAGSDPWPGVAVFRIPDIAKFTPGLIDALINRHSVGYHDWRQNLSLTSLTETLGLEFVYWHKQNSQKTGNCTYTSAKSGIRALLAIRFLIDKCGGRPEVFSSLEWENAFNQTRAEYQDWNDFDKNLVILDALNDASPIADSGFVPREQLQGVFESIQKIITQKSVRHLPVASKVSQALEFLRKST